MSETAYLILENGMVFEGKAFGADKKTVGEIVFTTGMAGYLEALTDKNYCGQIIIQTFPLIGTYGVISEDLGSGEIYAEGYIVKHLCQQPSNFRSEGGLDAFLKKQNITGIEGIDTRALTKIIRENGVMKGKITKIPPANNTEDIKNFVMTDAVAKVSAKEIYTENPGGKYKIAVLDLGLNESFKRELINKDCAITVFPHDTSAENILKTNPVGIVLSNGPGNPAQNNEIIHNIKQLLKSNIPILGIDLGHQLLALANGFEIEKLKHGHHGANQPVKDLRNGNIYITAQNHGYTVVPDSIDKNKADMLFVNINDNCCEGIAYKNVPAFSVQFYPDLSGDPRSTEFLFDEFLSKL